MERCWPLTNRVSSLPFRPTELNQGNYFRSPSDYIHHLNSDWTDCWCNRGVVWDDFVSSSIFSCEILIKFHARKKNKNPFSNIYWLVYVNSNSRFSSSTPLITRLRNLIRKSFHIDRYTEEREKFLIKYQMRTIEWFFKLNFHQMLRNVTSGKMILISECERACERK